ncbi:MAG TPA: cell wall-binding repeat-containing protein [Acidimicrobiales bacterium]|nr:cell wall-binding repeat-containing protein [Acidimicrobiales bacterium]
MPLAALLAIGAVLPGATNAGAVGSGATLFAESFQNATVGVGIAVPATPAGAAPNSVCLTAGTNTAQKPVPGCNLATPDAAGAGTLRLTGATTYLQGGVFYATPLPATDGLDVTFNTYQYGGTTSADGIAVVLAAADPSNAGTPAVIGSAGGHLGYSGSNALPAGPGLADGYIGMGLDVYGNFSSPLFDGTGCTDPAWAKQDPEQVTIRGPGNALAGYCLLNSTAASAPNLTGKLTGGPSGTRATSKVPVEMLFNPTGAPVTTASGLSAPAGAYAIAFTPIGGSKQTLTGALPSTANGQIPAGTIPSAWINPSTGIPYYLTLGWVSSTGTFTDVHEIDQVSVNTLTGGPPPVRLAGASRVGTAVAVSQAQFPAAGSAGAVVLARSDDYPDALVGGPLAAAKHGPLLLTAPSSLDPVTEVEIKRVVPAGATVYELGGPNALNPSIDSRLSADGFQTVRLAGADRFATAAAVAGALGNPTAVLEATGFNFPDALAAVPAAISVGGAILLTNGASQASATTAYLVAHAGGNHWALGGPAAAADPSAKAVVGSDRFATSALAASTFFPTVATIGAADGLAFPDALVGGPYVGAKGGPLLLVPPSGPLSTAVTSYLQSQVSTVKTVVLFGGTSAVGPDVAAEIQTND